MSDRKTCPYCGEEIAATAKKCRFCGEWLDVEFAVPETVASVNAGVAEPLQPQGAEYARPVEAPVVNDCTGAQGLPATVNINGVPQSVDPSAVVQQYGGTLQQPYQQPVQHPMQQVINVQVHQEQTQSQEQTQIVVNEKSSSSGWLWFELLCVGGAVWWGTGHWWAGLITWIVLAILTQVPVIGAAICVVLGCGVGLLAGVISAAFSAPTWACWLIGIVVAAGVTGLNLEDRNADD